MADFIPYKSIQLLTPTPAGDGGVVLNSNFRTLADRTSGYTHRQETPSTEWVVHHNLNKPVSVTIVDDDGVLVISHMRFVDNSTLLVTPDKPFSGTAYVV